MDILEAPPFRPLPRANYTCMVDPIPLHSPGIWHLSDFKAFLSFALPRLHLQLAVIFFVTQLLYIVLRRFHLPRVVPEILTGFILGPTVLGWFVPSFTNTLFPAEGDVLLNILAKIGYILFMFLSGVKMDPSMVKKLGKKVWAMAALSIVIPVTAGMGFSPQVAMMSGWNKTPNIRFIILIQTRIGFSVIARLLTDLQILNSELGHLALATTLVRELVSLLISTYTTYQRVAFAGSFGIGIQAALMYLFLILTIGFLARSGFLWIIRQTPEGKPVNRVHIASILVAVLASAILCDNVGILYHFGPFLLGLLVPDGPPLGSTLEAKLDALVSGLFAPLLLTYCGLHSALFKLYDLRYEFILWIVLLITTAVKFAANFLPAVICKIPMKDAIALSLILNAQGIVELAGILTYRENGTVDDQTFATVTLSVCLTAAIVPQLVRSIHDNSKRYGGYQKRNILHTENNAELRILVCAHRSDDGMAALKLIEASNPTKEQPIVIYMIHLLELVGRSSPLLINHQLGQKAYSASGSRSQPIIDLLGSFQQQNMHSISTQVFTSVSLTKFMHDDICSLAFEKLVSLIILPFHKKWSPQGKVIVDNKFWRAVNRSVLAMAPCSVGILIDRRKVNRPSRFPPKSLSYRVVVVFVGGNDDREAMAYGKRMASAPGVQVTILRFFTDDNDFGQESWNAMLDAEAFRELKLSSSGTSKIQLREEMVNDGAELVLKVHAVEEVSDLIIVGRRHNLDSPMLSGLTEWMEVPELGPIGDVLASGKTDTLASVLVVQQQLNITIK